MILCFSRGSKVGSLCIFENAWWCLGRSAKEEMEEEKEAMWEIINALPAQTHVYVEEWKRQRH